MFYPTPEEESSKNAKIHINRHRTQKKKSSKKKHFNKNLYFGKKKTKIASTMSAWAENFTAAATWQLKHQLAYWKAKATSLEYENKVLHDIIRKSNCPSSSEHNFHSDSDFQRISSESESEEISDDDEDNLEVSEEFIEFLRSNAKYKEDARLERERLKAKVAANEITIEQLEAGPSKKEDPMIDLKKLYGAKWQKIAALEMSLQTNFIHETDKEKPVYWPNIPFNFNFS